MTEEPKLFIKILVAIDVMISRDNQKEKGLTFCKLIFFIHLQLIIFELPQFFNLKLRISR